MSERVTYTLDKGIADVRLNRADKMNALDPEMFNGIVNTGRELAGVPGLRAVVLSGEGRAFCAGLDFASFQGMKDRKEKENKNTTTLLDRSEESPANHAQSAGWVWRQLPVPVIAAVHGVAFGGGLQVALGADIRIVAPDVRMSVLEIKWGLVPDMAGTQLLRDIMRLDVLKELTFTGRELNGEESVALGLATRVAENPYEAAMALAKEIAGKSPDAIRAAKKLLDESRQGSIGEGLLLESQLQVNLIGTPNQKEAILAGFEKRAPVFSDPS